MLTPCLLSLKKNDKTAVEQVGEEETFISDIINHMCHNRLSVALCSLHITHRQKALGKKNTAFSQLSVPASLLSPRKIWCLSLKSRWADWVQQMKNKVLQIKLYFTAYGGLGWCVFFVVVL